MKLARAKIQRALRRPVHGTKREGPDSITSQIPWAAYRVERDRRKRGDVTQLVMRLPYRKHLDNKVSEGQSDHIAFVDETAVWMAAGQPFPVGEGQRDRRVPNPCPKRRIRRRSVVK